MKTLFQTALLVLISLSAFAQTVRTDTVKQGYYIPLDTNVVSCKVGITPKDKKVQFINTTSNRLPDSVVTKIGNLTPGSVIVYSEITVLNKGVCEKAPTVRYVIGSHNSVYALRDPSQPDTLPAAEIGSLVLDRHVISFDVSFLMGGAFYTYALTGNGVCCDPREKILTLESGTKVWVDNIKWKQEDGTIIIAPSKVYIVK